MMIPRIAFPCPQCAAVAFLACMVGSSPAAPVINEIHFNPPENPVRQEFVEIYNPGPTEINLGGWRIGSAVDFEFPDPTFLPADGYLLIAEEASE